MTDLGIVHLDCDESIIICNQVYSGTDPFLTHVCPNASWNGCDSTVVVDLQIDPKPLSNAGSDKSLNCIETQITLAGSGDTGPEYQITWNTSDGNIVSGQNTLSPIINAPGEYCLTVERIATGCSTIDCVTVFAKPQLTLDLPVRFCEGDLVKQATVSTDFSQPPYTLNWSLNGTLQMPLVAAQLPISWDVPASQALDFKAWMSYGNGCESDTFSQIIGIANAVADIEVMLDGCTADSLRASLSGNFTAPPQYLWSSGGATQSIEIAGTGAYSVTITDENGCTWQATEDVLSLYDVTCAVISGRATEDLNSNCLIEPNENGLAGWLVVAEGDHDFYATTTADGTYSLPVFPGDYTLKLTPTNALWETCSNDFPINLAGSGSTLVQDYLAKKIALCPKLNVDISTAIMRRCMPNTYTVRYCNEGTSDATDAYVEVQMDAWAIYTTSTIPGSNLGNNRLRFDIGDVPVGDCGSFFIHFILNCGAELGESICGKAEIFPNDDCLPSPNWPGGSVDVEVVCTDSVRFIITNKGSAPNSVPPGYVVIEDAIMYKFGDLPVLQPGESVQLAVPANGSTWWVEVEQEPNHPQPSQPIAFSEGCGTNPSGGFSKGFVNQLPLGDPEPWQDEDCIVATGSFDPNDKQGFPLGTDSAHFIKKNTALEYLIRFQNTGTDTAFTVVVRDTLAPSLVLTALRPGASSHPYEFEVYGEGILQFTFRDIMLPDSNVNEPGSHGFVSFEIPLKEGLAPLSTVDNKAGIYFDFNDPILTNTTLHTVEKPKVYAMEDVVLCKGEEWNGRFFEADTFVVSSFHLSEYDSFLMSNIHVLPTLESMLNAQTCPGEVYFLNGQAFQAPGEYTLSFTALNGCDSTVHLHLQTYAVTITQIEREICEGDFTVFNGDTLRVAGDYEFLFQSMHGCDSTVRMALMVLPSYETVQTVQICEGSSYEFQGLELGQPGTYVAQLTSVDGCDSAIVLQLQTVTSFDIHLPITICEGESYPFDGQLLTTSGMYAATFESNGGCDSLVTLELTVLPRSFSSVSAGICPDDTLDFFGQKLRLPGNYSYTLTAFNGCDSTISLYLFFLPIYHEHKEASICEGEQFAFEGDTLTSTGYYEYYYQGSNGCDSLISLQLNIKDTFLTNFHLQVVQGTTINGVPILGDTVLTQIFIASNGCDSLVATLVTVLPNSANESLEKIHFEVFPNPAIHYFLIYFSGTVPTPAEVVVSDILGKTCFRQAFLTQSNEKQMMKVKLEGWSNGLYLVRINSGRSILTKKVIVGALD
ncbi:MAG: T9SS type A sorting domain-containing protein [Saprospiraceae bacterium]|nr:T9SS type A sorting domain-containing protein [Saprospiraceae bacterium]